MKKLLLVCAAALFGLGQSFAQLDTDDYGIFNHWGLGVGIGLNGVTIDASTVLTPYVGIRGGVNLFPTFKPNMDLDLGEFDYDDTSVPQGGGNYGVTIPDGEVTLQAKTSLTTGHVLFDIFPFPKHSSFRITAGAFFGSDKIVKVYNKKDGALQDIYNYNHRMGQYSGIPVSEGKIGAELGDYFLEPDAKGNIEASIKVNSFRPYLGIGFGRSVPKRRIGCQFDMGVQFWGSPKVMVKGANGEEQLTEQNAGGEGGDAIKIISKVSVYPNISLRLVGRIF